MKKKLRIVNIDGTRGIGRSTQINMMANYLKRHDIPYFVSSIDYTYESAEKNMDEVKEYLDANPDGVALIDGSIARIMVDEMMAGVPQGKIAHKYIEILHDFECLTHEFGVVGLLLIMDNLDECSNRIIKKNKIEGRESQGIENFKIERNILKYMRFFDNHIISRSLKFQVINIDEMDSILDVHGKVKEYLKDNYQIKKPSDKSKGS